MTAASPWGWSVEQNSPCFPDTHCWLGEVKTGTESADDPAVTGKSFLEEVACKLTPEGKGFR